MEKASDLAARKHDPNLRLITGGMACEVRRERGLEALEVSRVVGDLALPLLAAAPHRSGRKPHELLCARRREDQVGPQVPVVRPFVGTDQGQRIALLGGPEFLLGTYPRRHIAGGDAHARQRPPLVANRQDRAVHPAHLVVAHHAGVELQSPFCPLAMLIEQRDDTLPIIGMQWKHIKHLLRTGADQIRRDAPLFEQAGRCVEDILVGEPFGMSVRRRLDGQCVALFGLAQCSLGMPALGMLSKQVLVDPGIPQRGGGQGRELLKELSARRGERVRNESAFEEQRADEVARRLQGKAQRRSRRAVSQVLVLREFVRRGRIVHVDG